MIVHNDPLGWPCDIAPELPELPPLPVRRITEADTSLEVRLPLGAAVLVMALLSFSLWAVIWAAAALVLQ